MLILLVILAYFGLLWLMGRFTRRHSNSNETFYRGNRQSPWYMVAFGMVGASISGVTFVSVPGMVMVSDMTYIQTCLGFIIGYFIVAWVLLPTFYRLNLTTIYTLLKERVGMRAYKTGASFFLLSKMTGAAVRFYLASIILQTFVLDAMGVPFEVTVVAMVLLIWLYTRRSGIATLVWTDTFQTVVMLTALLLIIHNVTDELGLSLADAVDAVAENSHSRMFVTDDWMSKQNFWKQFLSGIFIVVVMTGLDQDMMQKNLTCKTLGDAKKDMCTYGFAFAPVNLLFMSLGVLIIMLVQKQGGTLPEAPDQLLPMFVQGEWSAVDTPLSIIFVLGIVAACFSSADSALTAMTTSFCVDICGRKDDEVLRRRTHIAMAVVFVAFVLLFRVINSTSVIDAIYVMCSYTYGPLLGLFAYAFIAGRNTDRHHAVDAFAPYIAIASPLLCFAIDSLTNHFTGYRFGYELLMLNGLITLAGLFAARRIRK